jgi:hypothetical protein
MTPNQPAELLTVNTFRDRGVDLDGVIVSTSPENVILLELEQAEQLRDALIVLLAFERVAA